MTAPEPSTKTPRSRKAKPQPIQPTNAQEQAASTDLALTVAAPVQTIADPVTMVAQPVLEIAQPELIVEQPQASIQAPLPQVEMPGTPTLGTELASHPAPSQDTSIESAIAEPLGLPSASFVANLGRARQAQTEVIPGTLGVVDAPLAICIKSPCNVRTHYDPAKIEELAAGMKADGQLQECVGRWNAQGQLEIVAGETRRRGQVWREEQGELGLTLRVNVRELTDAQALRISTQENLQRKNMTPLEECHAMHRMQLAGDTTEDIQATFGFKTAQPVYDRVLVATQLSEQGQEQLAAGRMSFAQAVVIARATGEALQQSMIQEATRNWNPPSAAELAKQLTRGEFQVSNAKFKVEKSGLEVVRDLFDTFEPYFKDKGKALNAQIEWANAQAEKARKKGKHPFVAVETGAGSAYNVLSGSAKYTHTYYDGTGLIYYINTDTGELSTETNYKLKAAAVNVAKKSGEAKPEATAREMPDSAYQEAHELRALATREGAVGNTHLTLALTVWGLLVNSNVGMVHLDEVVGLPEDGAAMPALLAARTRLEDLIASTLYERAYSYTQHPILRGKKQPEPEALLRLLVGLTDAELLELLNTLTCVTAYHWATHSNKRPAEREYRYVAELTGANDRLAQTFKLTDAWLKRYPRHELLALADEAKLPRAPLEQCKTNKDMRAQILEHAERLHAEGFVPALVRFPTAPKAKAAKSSVAD